MRAAEREELALRRGVDELQNLLEYSLRERPLPLRFARKRYKRFAVALYRALERTRA
jgi:hypothetical protein